ncbi:hypothetical protein [Rathayibacter rathayi]|uniref:hypothetical protein n=1 Tax=Rathayibacter rathayi TaxID=33887 RepID=UPI000CE83372|nr:hypothetical protein [Rathayibacter rathayi]PPH34157.1 hypothetical protein C5C28_10125 [Rathayibacter rathayi]
MKLRTPLLTIAALLIGITGGTLAGTALSPAPTPGPKDTITAATPTSTPRTPPPVTRTGIVTTPNDPFWDHAGLKYPDPWPTDTTRREWMKLDNHAIQCDIRYAAPNTLTIDKTTCDFDNGVPLTTITLGPLT